jgi:hypothetical protein
MTLNRCHSTEGHPQMCSEQHRMALAKERGGNGKGLAVGKVVVVVCVWGGGGGGVGGERGEWAVVFYPVGQRVDCIPQVHVTGEQ